MVLKLLILLVLMVPVQAFSNDIHIHGIKYETTARIVCKLLKDGDVIKLNSTGGYVDTAIDIANCVQSKDILVEVTKADSAAFYIALSANKVCFTAKAVFGLHSYRPASIDNINDSSEYNIHELRHMYNNEGRWLRTLGYTKLQVYSILGLMMMTPSNSVNILSHADMISLLGKRYIGYCK